MIFNKVDLKSVNAMLGTSAERFDELSMAIDGAWVNMGSLSESLSDVGLDLTTMQGKLGKLGISEKAFSDILKTSGGNAETFAGALLEAADAGTSQADIISALGGNLEELYRSTELRQAAELGAAAVAENLPAAVERAYALADRIHFDNACCRRDIGRRAMKALEEKK